MNFLYSEDAVKAQCNVKKIENRKVHVLFAKKKITRKKGKQKTADDGADDGHEDEDKGQDETVEGSTVELMIMLLHGLTCSYFVNLKNKVMMKLKGSSGFLSI